MTVGSEETVAADETTQVGKGLADVPEAGAPGPAEAPRRAEETERTFEVPRRWTCPALLGVGAVARVEGPKRFVQTATYLDTPDLALLRAKRTLRRRVGGIDAGWHLKLPKSGETRTEVQVPLGSAVRVPAALRELVADVIGTAALVPVSILRTRRSRRELLDSAGDLIAELVDDTVEATVLLDGERIVRWREVELELGPAGTDADLDVLTQALLASRLVVSTAPSKLGRALAEPLGRRGDAAATPRPTAGEVVMAYLADQLGVLQALEPAVRVDSPDAVHKTRVATRRARSVMKTFRDLFDPSVDEHLRGELKWLADLLGGPRDAEVLLARLEALLADVDPTYVIGPVPDRLLGMLRADHDASRATLIAALDGRRYERLLAELTEAVMRPPYLGDLAHAPAPDVVARFAGKASAAVRRTAARASDADADERDVIIHDIRKRAKAARYADEAVAPVLRSKGAAPAWTRLQEALGDYQDGVVAVETIQRACATARAAGEDTFTYGVLVEREAAAGRAIRSQYEDLLRAALRRSKKVRG